MKFNCGPSRKERHFTKTVEWHRKSARWHKVFLWLPRRFENGDCRWLEYCERKYVYSHWWYNGTLDPIHSNSAWFEAKLERIEYRAL